MIALLVVATALAFPAAAQTTIAGRYSVAFAMTDDGKVVDAPSLTIAKGGSARMQIDGRYRIGVTLSPLSNNQMQRETIISRPEAGE